MTTSKKKGKTVKQREAAKKRKERAERKAAIEAVDGIDFFPSTLQYEMAKLIINPEDRRSMKDKCESIKLPERTFYNWWAKKEYRQYCVSLMEKYGDIEEINAYRALNLQIKRGNVQAIKVFFELRGKLGKRLELSGPGGTPIQTDNTVRFIFNMPEPPDQNDSRAPEEEDIEGEEYEDRPLPAMDDENTPTEEEINQEVVDNEDYPEDEG